MTMKITHLTPIEARDAYRKHRQQEIHNTQTADFVMGNGRGFWGRSNAEAVLRDMSLIERLVHFLLAYPDLAHLTPQDLQNLQKDAAYLADARARAEAVLKG